MSVMTHEWWGMIATTAGGEPPPVTGGFKDPAINLTFTSDTNTTGSPAAIANTFHDGTIPGVWVPFPPYAQVAGTAAVWQVDVAATVTHLNLGGLPVTVTVALDPNNDPASRVVLLNTTMSPSDVQTISYSHTFAALYQVAIPIQQTFGGASESPTTLVGTVTFTFIS